MSEAIRRTEDARLPARHVEAILEAVAEALALATRRAYGSHWWGFAAWCEREAVAALPADPAAVPLASVMRDGLLPRSEAAAIRWREVDLQPDGSARLQVRPSKTDQEGRARCSTSAAPPPLRFAGSGGPPGKRIGSSAFGPAGPCRIASGPWRAPPDSGGILRTLAAGRHGAGSRGRRLRAFRRDGGQPLVQLEKAAEPWTFPRLPAGSRGERLRVVGAGMVEGLVGEGVGFLLGGPPRSPPDPDGVRVPVAVMPAVC